MPKEFSPQVSVIVPVYNKEKYLHRCIDSILAQTFTNFEVLLVDDGSTDGSGAICDEYATKEECIRVFHKRNGGVSSTRNLGLYKSKGDWVAFIDADDYVDTCYLENLLPIAGEDFVMDSSDNRSQHFEDAVYKGNELFHVALSDWHILCPWGKLYRRDIIVRERMRFDEVMPNGEDTLFNLNYLAYVSILRVISSSLYHYESNVGESLCKSPTPYEKALYKARLVYAIGNQIAERNKDISIKVLISKYAGITWGLWKNLLKYKLSRRKQLVKELFAMRDMRNLMQDYLHCDEGGKLYALFYHLGRFRLFSLAALCVR